jgi:transposase
MLNIYLSSIPSFRHLPPVPRRRRGGQPLNRNALIHGLYALKNSTPLNRISSALPALPRKVDANSMAVSQQIIQNLMQDICQVYQQLISAENNRAVVAWFNTLVRMVSIVGRLKLDFKKRFMIGSDLQVVSEHALALIHNSFWEKGSVGEVHSFRAYIDKSNFNSVALQEALCRSVSRFPFPFLTPRQWAVLAPMVPPAERTGKRGRPPADPRILLDAIFWKQAHHARWQDLPPWYPPMLTCRRYYRRLFLSGRLDALYSALYQDLLTRGMVSLHGLVKQGHVAISENKVIMRRGMDKSWQMRAALLILQQGYQALRRERREKAHGNRPQIHPARMIARDKEIQARASIEEKEFTFSPIDLAHLGSDQEIGDELAVASGKDRIKLPRHIDKGNYKFTPVDLGNLGSDEGDDEPPFLQPVSPAPPGTAQDILSPPGSYSPAVPNTQSHSGELTP